MARPWRDTHLTSRTKEYTFKGQGTDNILLGPQDVLPSQGLAICIVIKGFGQCSSEHIRLGRGYAMPPYYTARGDKKTTHNDGPTTKGKDCDERETHTHTLVKLKTKRPICNMKFFEIKFSITRVYMFAQVFEARVNPYHPPLHHHPLDAYYDSVVEELHPS